MCTCNRSARAWEEIKLAILDVFVTNYEEHLSSVTSDHPLQTDNAARSDSDHRVLCIEAKLPRPKKFAWETHEYLRLTEEGTSQLVDLIRGEQWLNVKNAAPDS